MQTKKAAAARCSRKKGKKNCHLTEIKRTYRKNFKSKTKCKKVGGLLGLFGTNKQVIEEAIKQPEKNAVGEMGIAQKEAEVKRNAEYIEKLDKLSIDEIGELCRIYLQDRDDSYFKTLLPSNPKKQKKNFVALTTNPLDKNNKYVKEYLEKHPETIEKLVQAFIVNEAGRSEEIKKKLMKKIELITYCMNMIFYDYYIFHLAAYVLLFEDTIVNKMNDQNIVKQSLPQFNSKTTYLRTGLPTLRYTDETGSNFEKAPKFIYNLYSSPTFLGDDHKLESDTSIIRQIKVDTKPDPPASYETEDKTTPLKNYEETFLKNIGNSIFFPDVLTETWNPIDNNRKRLEDTIHKFRSELNSETIQDIQKNLDTATASVKSLTTDERLEKINKMIEEKKQKEDELKKKIEEDEEKDKRQKEKEKLVTDANDWWEKNNEKDPPEDLIVLYKDHLSEMKKKYKRDLDKRNSETQKNQEINRYKNKMAADMDEALQNFSIYKDPKDPKNKKFQEIFKKYKGLIPDDILKEGNFYDSGRADKFRFGFQPHNLSVGHRA